MSISPGKLWRRPLDISSWSVLVVVTAVYWLTADTSVSFWDCPEYVTTAYRLEIGHPPGNPIWTLAMRVITIPFDQSLHAYVINLTSGLLMALAAFLFCRIIFVAVISALFASRIIGFRLKGVLAGIIASGSSFCFAFCDSVWFSAVEAEVYAMSAFLSACMLRIIQLWWFEPDIARKKRLIFLLAYLTGLSLGIHELNLLCIPVIILIILYKKYPRKLSLMTGLSALVISVVSVFLILKFIMEGIPEIVSFIELKTVNSLGMPYGSGGAALCILFLLFLSFLFLGGLQKFPNPFYLKFSTPLWCVAFILIGFSSFMLIYVRAASSPPMNEGTPGNAFALSSYIDRSQYPSRPLVYGATPYSQPMFQENYSSCSIPTYSRYLLKKGKPKYVPLVASPRLYSRSGMLTHGDSLSNYNIELRGKDGYMLADYNFTQVLTPELNMWFPRITSRNINDRESYADWAGMTEESMERVSISETFDPDGNPATRMNIKGERPQKFSYRPTQFQNLRFFLSYQLYYMYLRYLLWNFVGKQNDFPSQGEIEHGNFITGINALDETMIGPLKYLPDEIWRKNRGRNVYFAIPFFLGIIGVISLIFQGKNGRRALTVTALLFFMTGIAVVIYLNQSPGEPRERDYSFICSYMAFCMWIAVGILGITQWVVKKLSRKCAVSICIILSFGTPALMAFENYDDHDRRGRFEPAFIYSGFLDHENPAIILSQGDNCTFPLWYLQEVEGKGTHHSIVDVTYLNVPEYVVNLMKQGEKGIRITGKEGDLIYGSFIWTRIPDEDSPEPIPLEEALRSLYSQKTGQPLFPSSSVIIKKSPSDSVVLRLRDLTGGSSFLSFQRLMMLELVNSVSTDNDKEAIFIPGSVSRSLWNPLSQVLKPALSGQIYAPGLDDHEVVKRLGRQVDAEIVRLSRVDFLNHYQDPLLLDQTVRYRGNLVIAAKHLIDAGDFERCGRIIDTIDKRLPYDKIQAGNFSVADSIFYEGEAYFSLLLDMAESTHENRYISMAENLLKSFEERGREWNRYYASLNKEQRALLSPRSIRLAAFPARIEKLKTRLTNNDNE